MRSCDWEFCYSTAINNCCWVLDLIPKIGLNDDFFFNCNTFAYTFFCICFRFSRFYGERLFSEYSIAWIVNNLEIVYCSSINALLFQVINTFYMQMVYMFCRHPYLPSFFFKTVSNIFKTICFGLTFTWSACIPLLKRKYVNAFFFQSVSTLGTHFEWIQIPFCRKPSIVFDTGFKQEIICKWESTNESLMRKTFFC